MPNPERGPKPITPIRQPQIRMTAGVRQDGRRATDDAASLCSCTVALASFVAGAGVHAGAAARRCTGFSTIGRLITAESKPNNTDSHHTTS